MSSTINTLIVFFFMYYHHWIVVYRLYLVMRRWRGIRSKHYFCSIYLMSMAVRIRCSKFVIIIIAKNILRCPTQFFICYTFYLLSVFRSNASNPFTITIILFRVRNRNVWTFRVASFSLSFTTVQFIYNFLFATLLYEKLCVDGCLTIMLSC